MGPLQCLCAFILSEDPANGELQMAIAVGRLEAAEEMLFHFYFLPFSSHQEELLTRQPMGKKKVNDCKGQWAQSSLVPS